MWPHGIHPLIKSSLSRVSGKRWIINRTRFTHCMIITNTKYTLIKSIYGCHHFCERKFPSLNMTSWDQLLCKQLTSIWLWSWQKCGRQGICLAQGNRRELSLFSVTAIWFIQGQATQTIQLFQNVACSYPCRYNQSLMCSDKVVENEQFNKNCVSILSSYISIQG